MPRKAKQKMDQISIDVEPDDTTPTPTQIEPEMPSPDKGHGLFASDGELVIDVFETHSDFVVLAAIAGVQIKDLDISIEKDMMVIKGDRSDPHEHPGKKYFYQECYWGPFSRKIVLPENIDTQSADAQMDKGMLTIKIPKVDPASTPKAQIEES